MFTRNYSLKRKYHFWFSW